MEVGTYSAWQSLVSLKLFTRNTRLVEARRNKGENQAQMAKNIHMSPVRLSQIENLKFVPSDSDMTRIADYLIESIDYLFPDILMEAIEEGVFIRRDAQLNEPEIISLTKAPKLRASYDGETQMIEEIDRKLLKEQIDRVLDTLDPREKLVLEMRFGLTDGHARTLEEVAQRLPWKRLPEFSTKHVTRERVRQIEQKALRKLRNPARSEIIRESWSSKGG